MSAAHPSRANVEGHSTRRTRRSSRPRSPEEPVSPRDETTRYQPRSSCAQSPTSPPSARTRESCLARVRSRASGVPRRIRSDDSVAALGFVAGRRLQIIPNLRARRPEFGKVAPLVRTRRRYIPVRIFPGFFVPELTACVESTRRFDRTFSLLNQAYIGTTNGTDGNQHAGSQLVL